MSKNASSEAARADVQLTRVQKRLFRVIVAGVVLAAFVLLLVGAEYAVRRRERTRTTPPDFFPCTYYPHKRLRYGMIPNYDYFGWFRINSEGFRGRDFSPQKQPGALRVICIGGSTTFDIGSVGRDLPWPEALEQELSRRIPGRRVEVINMGIPGATALDALIDLQMRGMKYEPDLAVLYQGHNDFVYSIFPDRPKKSTLYPLEQRPRGWVVRWLEQKSLLYGKGQGVLWGLWDRATGVFSGPEGPPLTAEQKNKFIEDSFSAFRANLGSFLVVARENGIAVALPEVAIPYRADGRPGECRACDGLSPAYGGLPLPRVTTMFARYNSASEELARRHGAHFIDTDGFAPADDEHFHDSVHFAPKGSLQFGTKLGEAIAPILQGASAPAP